MHKYSKSVTGLCLALLLMPAGCSAVYQAPEAVQIRPVTELGGRPDSLDRLDRPVSPVMQDVYDRSIPAEVYSAD
ncbi:hypothetical protein D3C76_1246490 [compost metagenome]